MKVAIDNHRCTGHGLCFALEPTVFTDDEAGYGQLAIGTDVPSEDQIAAFRRAVHACPEQAIVVEASETSE
ncbi:ferredoxin [Rhodococcus wratislaviensis]|uniref:ferredoxin n=1 Tax=Rhodococcus wratislaviensis TaxID=44752 RepID=UPI00364E36A8